MFKVKPYKNPASGTESFRVERFSNGVRVRKNFSSRLEAEHWAFVENQKLVDQERAATPATRRPVLTSLTDDDIILIEGLKSRWSGKKTLPELVEMAEAAAQISPSPLPLPDLIEEWLAAIEPNTADRWMTDLKYRGRRFAAENKTASTQDLTTPFVRRWLVGLPLSQVSKSHFRAALSKFFGWLVQMGHLKDNPCVNLKLESRTVGTSGLDELPAILTPPQAQALMNAFMQPNRVKCLGWAVLCLFCGLRPEAEAGRLQWSEINLETGEIQVFGRKRGASVRVFKVTPQALSWLKFARAKDPNAKQAGYWSKPLRRSAVKAANEALKAAGGKLIEWEEDILRHTYASYRAPSVPVHELAREMGTSVEMLHRHYRHPVGADNVADFVKVATFSKGHGSRFFL